MSGYLIASDFDNTICFWSDVGRIYDKDRKAIRRFREAGNKFVIVSGRSYPTAIEVFNKMDFHDMDFFLVMSGSYGAYPDETEIYDERIESEKLIPLCRFFRESGAKYLGVDVGKLSYSVDVGGDMQPKGTISLDEFLSVSDTFTSINVGYNSREEAYANSALLEKNFSHIITPLQNNKAIDMPPAGIDKSVAVARAAKLLGIEKDKIYTVGDNYNDIKMLADYHGSAMLNGPEDVHKYGERKVRNISEVIDHIMSLD